MAGRLFPDIRLPDRIVKAIITGFMQTCSLSMECVMGDRENELPSNLLVEVALSRDSPDDSQTGLNIRGFPASCKIEVRFGRLPSVRAARTVVEGLIWPFSLAFGRTPPIDCS